MTDSFLPPLDPQEPQNPQSGAPQGETVFTQLSRGWAEQEESAFMRSFRTALNEDPDMAAESQRLGKELGVSPSVVQNDIKWARQMMAQREAKLWLATQADPVIRRQFENPDFAAIAWDDLNNISAWENISGNWSAGKLEVERGKIGTRMMSGTATQQDHERLATLDKMLTEELPSGDSWVGGPARMFGQMSQTLPKALALGAGTASVAIIAGNAGPQAGVPEEVISVPAAFLYGVSSGMAAQAFQIEGGNAYIDYKRAGFDEGRARVSARMVGTVNAGLEVLGFSALAAPVKGLVKDRIKRRIGERLARMTPFEASKRLLQGTGVAIAGETGTEVLQELSTMVGEEFNRSRTESLESRLQGGFRGTFQAPGFLDPGEGGDITIDGRGQITVGPKVFEQVFGETSDGNDVVLVDGARRKFIEQYDKALPLTSAVHEGEVIDRLIDTAWQTVKGVWLPGAVGPSIRLVGDRDRIATAKRMDKVLDLATKNVEESKAAARNADVFSQYLAGTLEGSVADTVYITKQRFLEKMESAGITEAQIERELPDVAKQLREPAELNEDIEIPMADWLGAKMSEADLGKSLREDMRIAGKDSMSLNEALEAEKNLDGDVKALREQLDKDEAAAKQFRDELTEIETRVRNEITATGAKITGEQARVSAGLHRRIIEGLALRARVTPAAFEAKFGQMQIVRGQGVGAATFAQTDDTPSVERAGVFGEDGFNEDFQGAQDDEFLYHVTTPDRADSILDGSELRPGEARSMAPGVYAEYSAGRVFLSEKSGVSFWEGRVREHLQAQQDETVGDLVVLKFRADLLDHLLETDELGERDSRAGSYFVPGGFDIGELESQAFNAAAEGVKEKTMRADTLMRLAGGESVRGYAEGAREFLGSGGTKGAKKWITSTYRSDEVFEDLVADVHPEAVRTASERAGLSDSDLAKLPEDFSADTLSNLLKFAAALDGVLSRDDGATAVVNEAAMTVGGQDAFLSEDGSQVTFFIVDDEFSQGKQRGSFDPTDFVTKLYDNADASTFFHEAAHYYLEALLNVARSPNAPKDILDDLDALAKWGGMAGWEDLASAPIEDRRKLHEMWAYGFENYLHRGKPLTADRTLLGTFRRVRRWLTNVYKDITRTPEAGFRAETGEELPQLSDEVRAVMDRLVETQEAIDYAKKVRSVEAIFEIAEDLTVLQTMPPDQREALRELLFDADLEADEKLGAVMLRQLRYMKNFRGKFLKEVQAQTRAAREKIHAGVEAELANDSVHRLQRFLNTGEFVNEAGIAEPTNDIPRRIHEADGAGLPSKWVSPRGASADVLAVAFGYQSKQDLLDDLLGAMTLDEHVDQVTDERMAAEHEDLLNEDIVEERLIEAMSGPTFQKLIAEQLRHFDKGLPNARVQRAAARAVARRTIGDRVVGDLRPLTYSLAAGRAQREASKARREGDIPAYRAALRRALFQNALAEAATEAQAEVRKGTRDANKRFLRTPTKLVSQGRIPEFVTAGRIILSRYGLVTPPPDSVDNPHYDPFAPLGEEDPMRLELQQTVDEETTNAQDYRVLTVDELRDLFDTADSLWFRSRRDKQILLDGERAELETVLADMVAKLGEHTVKDRGITGSLSKKEKRGKGIRGHLAQFRRMEFALQALDRGTPGGIFTRAIWRRAKDAANLMRLDEKKYLTDLQALIDELDLTGGTITARGLTLRNGDVVDHVFGNGEVSGKAELIMALLHSGNESNMFKLVAGYGWGAISQDKKSVDTKRWLDFIDQKVDDGTLTKKDLDVVQAIWNLNEKLKPQAQKAHHEVAGYTFKEIPAAPLALVFPGEGLVVYRGGYVPAATDRDQVVDARLNGLDDLLNFQKKLPVVPKSFTKNRAALYARELDLNPMRLAEHVHSVLLFSHLAPAVKDIRRVTEHRTFKDAIDRVDSNFREEILTPWIEALASQRTTKAGKDTWGWLNRFRSRAGQAVMFFNVKNVLQNYTGIPIALTVVDGRNLRAGLGEVLRDREGAMQRVKDQSNYMRDRFENADIYDVRDRFQALTINRGKLGDTQAWFQKNAYWLQRITQEPIDVAVWLAAYNKAVQDQGPIDGDKAHNEAVQRADSAVRQTQTGNNPEDLSSAERGSAWMKIFLQFRGWFISYGNLIRNQVEIRNQRDDRIAALGALYMIGIFTPLVAAEAIDALTDGDEIDRDDDGAVWDDWTWRAMQAHIGAIGGAIPIWGDAGMVAFSTIFDPKSWNARMPEPPTISALREGLAAMTNGDLSNGRKLRSVLSFLSVMSGVPVTKLLGPAVSGYELATGQAETEGQFGSLFEIPRAVLTGKTQRPR